MADWSIWKALEEWRSKRHELDPVFAYAGIAPELDSMVNRITLDLRREPPTRPLLSGDKIRDDEEMGRYGEAFYKHYDESLYKAENLLRMTWVPEAGPIGDRVRSEIKALRETIRHRPGVVPDFSGLEQMLYHYLQLDLPGVEIPQPVLAERRQMLIDIAGYPLHVQHAMKSRYDDSVPPLASSAFREQLQNKIASYLATPWLHSRVITHWYLSLALDAALARKKRDATDDARIKTTLRRRWPSLSVVVPELDHADTLWYLLLAILAIGALFMEWWVIAIPLLVWLHLSVGGHQRERNEIEAKRAQLAARAQSMKTVRDRFAQSQMPLDRLSYQLRQLDEAGEYFDDKVFALIKLHQIEA